MRTTPILTMLFFAAMSAGQGKPDEAAIRNILTEEVAAWNKGDAQAHSQHFAADGTFTNILGMFFTGTSRFLTGTKKYLRECFAELCSVRTWFRSGSSVPRPPLWKHLHGFRGFQHRVRHAPRCQGTPAHSAPG